MAKFPKDEMKEKGGVKAEKAEGLAMNKKEMKAGKEAHPGAAKKAFPILKKKGK